MEAGSRSATHCERVTEMAKDTVALVLNGEVTLANYAKAVKGLLGLMTALGNEYASGNSIDWKIECSEAESATITIRGTVQNEEEVSGVETVINAYEHVGQQIAQGEIQDVPVDVANTIRELTGIIDTQISSLRFETADFEWEVDGPLEMLDETEIPGRVFVPPHNLEIYGAVKGRIQSISRERTHRFAIYEYHSNRAVSCYLRPNFEEKMRQAWGKLAMVEGTIRRDPRTGAPVTVRNVQTVEVIPEGESEAWRDALGCAPNYAGGIPAEKATRRVRDA